MYPDIIPKIHGDPTTKATYAKHRSQARQSPKKRKKSGRKLPGVAMVVVVVVVMMMVMVMVVA